MQMFTVLYRDDSLLPADAPLAFQCQADDADHAEEQAQNAYPGCEVVWILETSSVSCAYGDYWRGGGAAWVDLECYTADLSDEES